MADQKISELNSITGGQVDDDNDELAIVDNSANETKRITRAGLLTRTKLTFPTSPNSRDLLLDNSNLQSKAGLFSNSGDFASRTGFECRAGFGGDYNGAGWSTLQGSAFAIYSGTDQESVRVTGDGDVGIGITNPGAKLDVIGDIQSSGVNFPSVRFKANGATELYGLYSSASTMFFRNETTDINPYNFGMGAPADTIRGTNSGDVGIGTATPGAKLDVNGSLSKNSGSFKIDHPLKPDTHHLVHSFVEGPQADNLYRGKVALVDGTATVNLDEAGRMSEGTFEALNGNIQCFTTNEDGWTQVRGQISGNLLVIDAEDTSCTDTVSWLVIGERHDSHMIETNWTDENGRVITEPEKATTNGNS